MKRFLIGLVATLMFTQQAHATLMSFDFTITASDGSASGSFAGTDANNDSRFDPSELSSFFVEASGTASTLGPYTLSLPTATVGFFDFDLASKFLAFIVEGPNSIDSTFFDNKLTYADNVLIFEVGYRPEDARGAIVRNPTLSVTPSAVPLPTTLALFGLGLLGLRLRRKR